MVLNWVLQNKDMEV